MRLNVALRGIVATWFALFVGSAVFGFGQASLAQEPVGGGTEAYVYSIWDLKLGDHAKEMDFANYADFSCGTNGGPPSTELEGWVDFAMCPAEPGTGLHEIYFRYDDTLEYWALAGNLPIRAQRYRSTTAYDLPIIVSGLFDDDGFLMGIRIVSDQRADRNHFDDLDMRQRAFTLRNFLTGRYNNDFPWSCVKAEPEEGEEPFQKIFIKDRCERLDGDRGVMTHLAADYYRRPGQAGMNIRIEGRAVEGEFWSETRMEEFLVTEIPNREARLAEVANIVHEIPEQVLRARDCPGCDFFEVDFTRADLRGANLAGANLEGAVLHDARLAGANLEGANLTGAILNKADLKRANLVGADLSFALLFEARLDGADATGANFEEARMARVQLINGTFDDANFTYVDMREGRLGGASFRNATLTGAWLHVSQLTRADLTGAIAIGTSFYNANMVKAIVLGADLTEADLRQTDLRETDFTNANLTNSYFKSALVLEAIFTGAITQGTDFPAGFVPNLVE
ncbi:MAG: pentapeptide repeat-containing protein [Alphaproteobacteria bacterium]|jgi:uncharacterized protein YjbI with pentapeptide repeats|nr:pentapeptide repeat-containing protein [Alphaproteobacteria bacterium]MBT4710711.1 pentapeptide repeat-containing protein [Alphaproteobacteria bacterium]MBT5860509.1 pentapeptide repeat-containing protein [Alphaproteobacteria bacterium]